MSPWWLAPAFIIGALIVEQRTRRMTTNAFVHWLTLTISLSLIIGANCGSSAPEGPSEKCVARAPELVLTPDKDERQHGIEQVCFRDGRWKLWREWHYGQVVGDEFAWDKQGTVTKTSHPGAKEPKSERQRGKKHRREKRSHE